MNETPWKRLHRIVEKRREQLGMSRDDVKAKGGPSSEWIRQLKDGEGMPTVRRAAPLRALDKALGWTAGQSWALLAEDRSDWDDESLDFEEYALVHGDEDTDTDPAQRHFETVLHGALREMPADERERAMAEILKVLGRF